MKWLFEPRNLFREEHKQDLEVSDRLPQQFPLLHMSKQVTMEKPQSYNLPSPFSGIPENATKDYLNLRHPSQQTGVC